MSIWPIARIGPACGVNLKSYGRLLSMVLVGAMGAVLAPAQAQIYAGTTGSGAVVLSNFQTSDTPDVVIAAPVLALAPAAVVAVASAAPALAPDALRAEKLKPMIQKVALETSVSPQLLHAVISVESGYDAKAVSRTGAQG